MHNYECKRGISSQKNTRYGEYNKNDIKCTNITEHQDREVTHKTSEVGLNNTESTFEIYNRPLASVYSPVQSFEDIYDIETGFTRGTIFRKLDFPFVCGGMSGGASRG